MSELNNDKNINAFANGQLWRIEGILKSAGIRVIDGGVKPSSKEVALYNGFGSRELVPGEVMFNARDIVYGQATGDIIAQILAYARESHIKNPQVTLYTPDWIIRTVDPQEKIVSNLLTVSFGVYAEVVETKAAA